MEETTEPGNGFGFHFSLEEPSWVVPHGLSCCVDMFEGF